MDIDVELKRLNHHAEIKARSIENVGMYAVATNLVARTARRVNCGSNQPVMCDLGRYAGRGQRSFGHEAGTLDRLADVAIPFKNRNAISGSRNIARNGRARWTAPYDDNVVLFHRFISPPTIPR
jgi:hypothetical protein